MSDITCYFRCSQLQVVYSGCIFGMDSIGFSSDSSRFFVGSRLSSVLGNGYTTSTDSRELGQVIERIS